VAVESDQKTPLPGLYPAQFVTLSVNFGAVSAAHLWPLRGFFCRPSRRSNARLIRV
jgi:hypothetical protein